MAKCIRCGKYTRKAQPCIKCKRDVYEYQKKWKKKQESIKSKQNRKRGFTSELCKETNKRVQNIESKIMENERKTNKK